MDRYIFVQDDSCHWYCIKEQDRKEFEEWVDSFNNYKVEWKGKEFDGNRLGMHISNYTFTDLQER